VTPATLNHSPLANAGTALTNIRGTLGEEHDHMRKS